MKKKTVTELLEHIQAELTEALEEGDFDLVPGLATRGFIVAGRHLLRRHGIPMRPSWAQLRRHTEDLERITGMNGLGEVGEFVREEDKSSRYADDEWEYDEDALAEHAELVIEFIDKVLQLA